MTTPSAPLETRLAALNQRVLSTRARYGHVALLLAALAMGTLVAALLATEPALPARTQWSFAGLLLIAGAWATYAAWVLRHRWNLLANHRVVAGRMAVGFAALFTGATLTAGGVTGSPAAFGAAGVGALQLAVALWLLTRARHRFAQLQAERARLERVVGGASSLG